MGSDHPSHDVLWAYQIGELSETMAEEVTAHVSSCPDCQAELATLNEHEDSLVASLRRPLVPDPYTDEPPFQEAMKRVEVVIAGLTLPAARASRGADKPPDLGRLGEYELTAKLGEGGMGVVYKARHTLLDRVVAVKVLPKSLTSESRAVTRFLREIKAIGGLSHPNIVQAHDARNVEGTTILVMDYVDGLDLSELIKRMRRLGIAEACELVRQAAAGLQYAHEHGLVHRDIKPSNLLLERVGESVAPLVRVKILDFGLALLRADHPNGVEVTGSGQPMGTADYMAPEQVTDSHHVDIRADIYSLGCTLYKLLTGQVPFAGPRFTTAFAKMAAHTKEIPVPITQLRPEVPDGLAAVIERAMAKRPADRFAIPAELADAVAPFAAGADLARLAMHAKRDASSVDSPGSIASTDAYLSSSLTGTHRSCEPPQAGGQPALASDAVPLRPRKRRLLAAAGLPLLVILGVLIWINRTRIEVPDGSRVTIDPPGTVEIVPPVLQPNPASRPRETPQQPPPVSAKYVPLPHDPSGPFDGQRGQPLSQSALVAAPSPIRGIRSWTLETRAHRGPVSAMAYNPDGSLLATACDDGAIRLWNATTGQFVRALLGHDGAVTCLLWPADGNRLISCGEDGKLLFWSLPSGLVSRTIAGHDGRVNWLASSPDGSMLASAGADCAVRVWEVAFGESIHVLKGHTKSVVRVAWSGDGKTLASAGEDNSIRLWDAASGEPRQSISTGVASWLAWAPDSRRLASSVVRLGMGELDLITFWDPETGQTRGSLGRIPEGVSSFAWSPNGATILTGGAPRQGEAILWQVADSKVLWRTSVPDGLQGISCVAWSPDGAAVALGTAAGTLHLVSSSSGTTTHVLPGHSGTIRCLRFSPDGKRLASGHAPSLIRVWDVETGELVRDHPEAPTHIAGLAWSPDGQSIAYGIDPHVYARVWNLQSDSVKAMEEGTPGHDVQAWSPGSAVLACGGHLGNGSALFDPASGKRLRALPGLGNVLVWSADGRTLTVCDGPNVRICDGRSGQVLQDFQVEGFALSAAWAPDGRILAVCGYDRKITLWDTNRGKAVGILKDGHRAGIRLVRWNHDGSRLMSGNQWELCIWDTASGGLIRTIPGDCADLSPDGTRIASRGPSIIRLRRLQDGQTQGTILSMKDSVLNDAAISADGHWRGPLGVVQQFVCVVQTETGQETLTPVEFSNRYDWKNDPSQVCFGAEPSAGTKREPDAATSRPSPTPPSGAPSKAS